jgi:hypothetical protein
LEPGWTLKNGLLGNSWGKVLNDLVFKVQLKYEVPANLDRHNRKRMPVKRETTMAIQSSPISAPEFLCWHTDNRIFLRSLKPPTPSFHENISIQ